MNANNEFAEQTAAIVVLSGPTAVGKGTVETRIKQLHPELWVSVSATTRKPREGEKHGVDYLFVSEEEFARMEEAGEFLETALVHGMSHYGTPIKPLLERASDGSPALVEIDLQGARRVRERAEELKLNVFFVFLAPPSFDDLAKRLNKRGTETEEQKRKRLETAKVEMAAEKEFDRVIVNDDIDKAAEELWQILKLCAAKAES